VLDGFTPVNLKFAPPVAVSALILYVVLSSSSLGKVIVFVFTAVTCPVAFVVIVSIAVNDAWCAGETELVVFVLVVLSWLNVIVSLADWSVVKSPPPEIYVPADNVIVASLGIVLLSVKSAVRSTNDPVLPIVILLLLM